MNATRNLRAAVRQCLSDGKWRDIEFIIAQTKAHVSAQTAARNYQKRRDGDRAPLELQVSRGRRFVLLDCVSQMVKQSGDLERRSRGGVTEYHLTARGIARREHRTVRDHILDRLKRSGSEGMTAAEIAGEDLKRHALLDNLSGLVRDSLVLVVGKTKTGGYLYSLRSTTKNTNHTKGDGPTANAEP